MSRHGIDCEKAPHDGDGYLHRADDDTPYDVDGCLYCGRCHGWIGAAPRPPEPANPPKGWGGLLPSKAEREEEKREALIATLRRQVKQADARGDEALRRAHAAEAEVEKLRGQIEHYRKWIAGAGEISDTCGAPTGWVRGSDLESANESKREAMRRARAAEAANEDLAMMIRMLVSSLKRHWQHAPQENDLPSRAVNLLKRHGLLGSPLREASDSPPSAAPSQTEPL